MSRAANPADRPLRLPKTRTFGTKCAMIAVMSQSTDADVKAYDAAKARIERGKDELIPLEIAERRLAGESTLKVWREYRGLTQEDLAKASKVSRPMIAAMEVGHKKGGIATLKRPFPGSLIAIGLCPQ